MTKIYCISLQTSKKQQQLVFDLEMVEMVERLDDKVYIFVNGKTSILECESVNQADYLCSRVYEHWRDWER